MTYLLRNDSNKTIEEVMEILVRDSVELRYGDITIKIQCCALENTRKQVSGYGGDRRAMMESVDQALRLALPKMLTGRFSKKVADNFTANLLLWTALKETVA